MMLILQNVFDFYSHFMQGLIIVSVQHFEGWSTSITAEFAAENIYPVNPAPFPQDGGRSLCSTHVHGISKPGQNARNPAQQQQAEEAERGQHLEKQLRSAAALLDILAKGGRTTNADDVEYFLSSMA